MERKVLSPWNYTNALSYLPSSQTQRLFWNQVKLKQKIKKKKRARAGEKKKKKRMRALARTFLNEGEKEWKEGGDKEIRTNVYEKKKTQIARAGVKKERMKALLEWGRKRKKRRGR